jgi:hypothetical protein
MTCVVLTVLTVFVLVLGGLGVVRDRADRFAKPPQRPTQSDEVVRELGRDLDSDLFFLASEALSKTEGTNLDPSNIIFKASAKALLDKRYEQRRIGDYTANHLSYDLRIIVMPMSIVASACTGNISVSGETGAFAAPAYYQVRGAVTFELKGPSDHTATVNITVDRIVPDITPYITTRLVELNGNGKSEYSDIGRMVRYMLTTLVRFRASEGIGSGPYDTEKDLLNEGDVELAVNLAVLLEEARLFGSYDRSALESIDHYFLRATDPAAHLGELSWEPYNPTGLRPWGSAETKNYARYQNRMSQGAQRSMDALFREYVQEGRVDPADLMALYLNLDHYETGLSFDPSDLTSILSERFLFDGRYSTDRRDASHLVYYSDVGPRELQLKDPSGTFSGAYREQLSVDQSPDYLTVGSSISVSKNITVPYKWMTNARLSEGSRTGGVPPPQPPPDHDWMMQWSFGIYGNFTVAVGRDPRSSQEDGTARGPLLNRTIRLDIPMNIFAFLSNRPMNSAMTFTNLNVGSPPGATYNFTYESLAYEHFANSTWSSIKDIYGAAIGDTIRLVKSSACPYPIALGQGSDITVLDEGRQFRAVPDDVWASVDDFVQSRLTGPKLSTQILKPLMNSEYLVRMEYIKGDGAPDSYTLRLTIQTNVGDLVMDLDVVKGGATVTGKVLLTSPITVKNVMQVEIEMFLPKFTPTYVRFSGSGIIQGVWSTTRAIVPETVQDHYTGVAVNLGSDITLWLIDRRSNGTSDLSSEMLAAVPKDLGQDPAANLQRIVLAERTVHVGSLELLLSTDGIEWSGLMSTDDAGGQQMLDWVAGHSRALVGLALDGRLDISTVGFAAAGDMRDQPDIFAIKLTGRAIHEIPLMYYEVSSQMFQIDRTYPALGCYATETVDLHGPVLMPLSASALTIGYTVYSYTSLRDPEVDYG